MVSLFDRVTGQWSTKTMTKEEADKLEFDIPENRVRNMDLSFLTHPQIKTFLNRVNVSLNSMNYYLRDRSALTDYLNEHDYHKSHKTISKELIERFIDKVENSN